MRGNATVEFLLALSMFSFFVTCSVFFSLLGVGRLKTFQSAVLLTHLEAENFTDAEKAAYLKAYYPNSEFSEVRTGPYKETPASRFYDLVWAEVTSVSKSFPSFSFDSSLHERVIAIRSRS